MVRLMYRCNKRSFVKESPLQSSRCGEGLVCVDIERKRSWRRHSTVRWLRLSEMVQRYPRRRSKRWRGYNCRSAAIFFQFLNTLYCSGINVEILSCDVFKKNHFATMRWSFYWKFEWIFYLIFNKFPSLILREFLANGWGEGCVTL